MLSIYFLNSNILLSARGAQARCLENASSVRLQRSLVYKTDNCECFQITQQTAG